MAIRLKANVAYIPQVEEINRKFVPRKETSKSAKEAGPVYLEGSGWMGGACRSSWRGGLGGCRRNYLVVRKNARTTPTTSEEMASRALFKQISIAANALLKSLSQLTTIQEMWKEASADDSLTINGVSAYGYTTYGWVFAVQYAGKKENPQYDVNTFPHEFDA